MRLKIIAKLFVSTKWQSVPSRLSLDIPYYVTRIFQSTNFAPKMASGDTEGKKQRKRKRLPLSLKERNEDATIANESDLSLSSLPNVFEKWRKGCKEAKRPEMHSDARFSVPPPFSALGNLGNTCYLNSVLQMLRYCRGFVDSLKQLNIQAEKLNGRQESLLSCAKQHRLASALCEVSGVFLGKSRAHV